MFSTLRARERENPARGTNPFDPLVHSHLDTVTTNQPIQRKEKQIVKRFFQVFDQAGRGGGYSTTNKLSAPVLTCLS
jgi:hypothetical protein